MNSGQSITVKDELASGGFAVVFRVTNSSHTTFALKRMNHGHASDRLAQVKQEIALMRRAHDASPDLIVRLVEQGADDSAGVIYLLLEYCPLGSLKDRCDRTPGHRLPFALLAPLFTQLATALADLHALDPCIVHRDVKLENVLLVDDTHVKLCDFGSATTGHHTPRSARQIADAEDDIQRNTTPAYRAPEQVDLYSALELGPKVDSWAFGCMLFLALHGRHAFGGGEGGLSSLSDFEWPDTPSVPKLARPLCEMLLRKRPAERASMRQLLATLAPLAKRPVPARHASKRHDSERRRVQQQNNDDDDDDDNDDDDDDDGDAVSTTVPVASHVVVPSAQLPTSLSDDIINQTWTRGTASIRFFHNIDMRSLGSVPASAACLMRLHHLLFAGHASAVDECVANLNFLRVVRDGWLRALAVDPLSAQFLADYAHLLAQKVALLSRYTALECNFALKPTGAASSLDATCARLALTLCNATILLIGPLVGAAAQLSEQQRACAASAPALVTECSNAFVLASHVLSVRPAECAALAPEYATTFARVTRLFEWASSRRLPVQLFPLPPAVPRFDGAFVVPLPLAIARR